MLNTYPSNSIYLLLVIISTLIIISSNNWFICWIGLELSLFGFLPIFIVTPLSSEGIIKYFLTQASGSITYLTSILTVFPINSQTMIFAISMNLGIFPFIQWIPLVIAALSWSGCIILTTLQNIGPLIILLLSNNTNYNIILGTISLLISSVLGFNQAILRAILSYSAISHSSWLVLATIIGENITLTYIFLYFFLTIFLFLSFLNENSDNVNNISNNTSETQLFILLILTGIPPFSIFLLNISIFFWFYNQPIVLLIILFSSCVSIFFYLTIALPQINNNPNTLTFMSLLNLIPLTILLLCGGNIGCNPVSSYNNIPTWAYFK